jgi:hypothetical protein
VVSFGESVALEDFEVRASFWCLAAGESMLRRDIGAAGQFI